MIHVPSHLCCFHPLPPKIAGLIIRNGAISAVFGEQTSSGMSLHLHHHYQHID